MEIKSLVPFDPSRDYNKELRDDELKFEEGRPFVFLRGLERLAKERGIVSARCIRLEQLGTKGVLCTYRFQFADGSIYEGSADATINNCDGNFKLYLSAMAESRAKARALRTAFAISHCSVEEISDMKYADDVDLGPIEEQQIVAIRHMANAHKLSRTDIISLLEVPRPIDRVEDLTRLEGIEIIKKLNKYKAKAKKS